MAKLSLYLFGAPRIVIDGVERYIRRRKGVALLAYLAVTQQVHSRDALATLFWPDYDQTGARTNLRRTLSELHQTLNQSWLEIDRATIRLHHEANLWVDVGQFQHLLDASRRHSHLQDQPCPHCLPLLQQAINLYSDDFLAGFTLTDSPAFDDWQAYAMQQLRAGLTGALERLVDVYSAQRQHVTAIEHARRWVALDPLHEAAHRRLMDLYARSNQQSAALRQYEECRQILAAELSVPPAPETTALYEQIRAYESTPATSQRRPMTLTAGPRHNLPTQTTSFIGRTAEMSEIRRLLLDEAGCRLLNLVGPGGIGKTRLALATAAHLTAAFPDGVFFVPLAPISEVTDIVPAIAEALQFTVYGSSDPQDQLLNYLRQKTLLLVIDNFEHLLAGADLLSAILAMAPTVTLLTTARERLQLQEEWVYEVQGLTVPVDGAPNAAIGTVIEELDNYSAVQLFLQRARQIRATFKPSATEMEAIVRICQLVGGMPLGIELAAPWARTLPCNEIVAEIEHNLDFLTTSLRNVPVRHRSIRVIFEQTWARLSQTEQTVLMQLSVFRGGCTREAAERITGASLSLLSSLVDKALLWRTNTSRYELHELLCQYAATKLQAAGQAQTVRDKHCFYYTEFLFQRNADLKGRRQMAALDEIETDFDNIRSAWQWATVSKHYEAVARALDSLFCFCNMRNRYQEGYELLYLGRKHLAPTNSEQPHSEWGKLMARGFAPGRVYLEPLAEVRVRLETALSIAQRENNQAEIAFCLWRLGIASVNNNDDFTESLAYYKQSLAHYRLLDDRFYLAHVLDYTGLCYLRLYQPRRGIMLMTQSAKLRREMGDKIGLADSLVSLGWIAYHEGRFTEAAVNWQEGYQLASETRNRQEMAFNLIGSAWLTLFNLGDFAVARTLAEEVQTIARDIDSRACRRQAQVLLGFLAGIDEDYTACRHFIEQAAYGSKFTYHMARMLMGLCLAACGLGALHTAGQHLKELLSLSQTHSWPAVMAQALPLAVIIKANSGEIERAVELMSLAFHHPLSPKGWLNKWPLLTRLRSELEMEMSSANFAVAWERGKVLDLEKTTKEIIAR